MEDGPRHPAAAFRNALDVIADARAVGADPVREGGAVVIGVDGAGVARRLLAAHGEAVRDFEFRHGRMDDVFLALTGRSAEEVGAA